MNIFNKEDLKKLYKPANNTSGEQNGQVTILGGSDLFHGAPFFAIKIASRIVDMVFFGSPESSLGRVAEGVKSRLFSFIWVDWEDVEAYVNKSDAILIGPGLRRFGSETAGDGGMRYNNNEGTLTRVITENILKKFPGKKWVIDGGSLQVMEKSWIPKNAILTPNTKEFEMLFGISPKQNETLNVEVIEQTASKHNCIIVAKGPDAVVTDGTKTALVKGGNAGLTKGGSGDALAGLSVALLAKNEPFLAASAASYILKAAADELYEKVGTNYNSDDLVNKAPETFHNLVK